MLTRASAQTVNNAALVRLLHNNNIGILFLGTI